MDLVFPRTRWGRADGDRARYVAKDPDRYMGRILRPILRRIPRQCI
jgi:hypothetical protein